MVSFKKKKVAVLMGGVSGEREISLMSGKAVLKSLTSMGYKAVGIDCGKDAAEKIRAEEVEVAFVALHGGWGENGSIQGALEVMEIPYTGSGVLASAIAMDKTVTKSVFEGASIRTPAYAVVGTGGSRPKALKLPLIVKPPSEGSTLGVTLVEKAGDFAAAVEEASQYGAEVLVEEFIVGRELTVSILDGKALPVIEIIPEGIYDYRAKYMKGHAEFRAPAVLNKSTEKKVKKMALDAYGALRCSGGARVDIILEDSAVPWALEVNTVPGLTELSLFPKAAAAVGMGYGALVEEMLLGATIGR